MGVEWVGTEGAKWKDGKGRGGGGEGWRGRVGGVTRLPGCDLIRLILLFPRQIWPRPPLLSYSS